MTNETLTPQLRAPGTAVQPAAKVTGALLACGLVAGPLYLAVGLAQALTRDGFDLTRHALSLLENGSLGWIQISNFLIAGLLSIASAIGLRQVLAGRPGGAWGPRLVGIYGAGQILAATFRADPADGFPPGTSAGPGTVSWHGMLHMASFGAGFLCLIAACFAVARGLSALGYRGSARFSRLASLIMLGGVAASFATAGTATAVAAVWIAVVAAWAWLAVTAARLRPQIRHAPRN